MANSISYYEVWKWFEVGGTNYPIYWVMFDPPYWNVRPSWYFTFSATNTFSSVDLSNFQQWHEVCVYCVKISVDTAATNQKVITWFKQYRWSGSRYTPLQFYYNDDFEAWYDYCYYMWVGVDPDEVWPDYTNYKFFVEVNDGELYAEKEFTVSNLSFDTTPHPAWYMWVEWSYLCYVPPSYYSGSSTTWYKHRINPDTWYSWSNVWTDKAWSIRIPSSSWDHHIYYVNEYGVVARTKSSYTRDDTNVYVGSDSAWSIWLIPSTSSWPEQVWYNYLCYVDGWWYKRRMGIWEI